MAVDVAEDRVEAELPGDVPLDECPAIGVERADVVAERPAALGQPPVLVEVRQHPGLDVSAERSRSLAVVEVVGRDPGEHPRDGAVVADPQTATGRAGLGVAQEHGHHVRARPHGQLEGPLVEAVHPSVLRARRLGEHHDGHALLEHLGAPGEEVLGVARLHEDVAGVADHPAHDRRVPHPRSHEHHHLGRQREHYHDVEGRQVVAHDDAWRLECLGTGVEVDVVAVEVGEEAEQADGHRVEIPPSESLPGPHVAPMSQEHHVAKHTRVDDAHADQVGVRPEPAAQRLERRRARAPLVWQQTARERRHHQDAEDEARRHPQGPRDADREERGVPRQCHGPEAAHRGQRADHHRARGRSLMSSRPPVAGQRAAEQEDAVVEPHTEDEDHE